MKSVLSRMLSVTAILVVILFLGCDSKPKDALASLKSRVKRITLENGLTVLLLKRDGAPVFSADITVKVGSIDEEPGSKGLAHFFEHMAFKGTETIGTKDWSKEGPLLEKIFEVGTKIVEAKKQGKPAAEYADLVSELKRLEDEEKQNIEENEFIRIAERNGGSDINAATSFDLTRYTVSMPANKLRLWAYLESERLKHPVMRGFFTEVDVVAEERRQRIDDDPFGKLIELCLETAFDNNPYRTVVVGPAADIQGYTPAKARQFFEKYYVPSRTIVSLVGNFDVDEAETVMREFFGALPGKSTAIPDIETSIDFSKPFPRNAALNRPEQPRFYLGYHRPSFKHEDDIVFDFVAGLLCHGNTSRLVKKLVIDDKKAAAVSCWGAFPSARVDNMFAFFGMPFGDHSNQQIKEAMLAEVKKMADEGPLPEEMQRVRNQLYAGHIYKMQSNSVMAQRLSFGEALTGDWQYFYQVIDRFEKMTPGDIQRVIKTYMVPGREVMVEMKN